MYKSILFVYLIMFDQANFIWTQQNEQFWLLLWHVGPGWADKDQRLGLILTVSHVNGYESLEILFLLFFFFPIKTTLFFADMLYSLSSTLWKVRIIILNSRRVLDKKYNWNTSSNYMIQNDNIPGLQSNFFYSGSKTHVNI